MQQRIVRIHRAALSHGHMMRRVKTGRSDISHRTRQLLFSVYRIFRTQRVAVILHQPEAVLFTERADRLQVKGIAKRMRNHDRLRLLRKGLLQHGHINIVLRNRYVHKYRHRAVLYHRRHRRGKSRRHGDDLIPPVNPAFSKKRRGQRHKCQQVGGGAGINKRAETNAQIIRHLLFKLIRISS